MKAHVDATYITNTLFYKYLLPLNEQNKELSKILHCFNLNFKRNISSMSYYKPFENAFMLINKNISGYKYYIIFFNTILII